MGYKNAELRLGKNDTQLDDPRAGEVALRIDSTGAIFTKPEGAEEVAVGGASLSDYKNVIVVDADGSGDYETLNDAVLSSSAGNVIMVVSSTTEATSQILVSESITILVINGVTVNLGGGELRVTGDAILSGGGIITSSNASRALLLLNSSPLVSDLTIVNTDEFASAVELSMATGTNNPKIRRVVGISDLGPSILIGGAAGLGSDYVIEDCDFGSIYSYSPIADIRLYKCRAESTTNIAVTAGNYSNIVNGITWPSIP